jgi:hypothetical protein
MTFLEFLDTIEDDNGTISWREAVLIIGNHHLMAEFDAEYGHMAGERIDAGELAVWMGY